MEWGIDMKLTPTPVFHTIEEVREFLHLLLKELYYNKITWTDVFSITKICNYKIKSASNNSIQGSYYGRQVNIRTRNTKNKGVILL